MASDTRLAASALVTGGARRIGRAIVRALARTGYAVAIHAHRSIGPAEELRAEIAAAGGRAAVVAADLADHDDVVGLVAAAAAEVGPLTLLVNNASVFEPDGIGQPRPGAVRPPLRRQRARAGVPRRSLRRAGRCTAGRHRCLDRQSARSAHLQVDAELSILRSRQERALCGDDVARPGARAAGAGQCGRARSGAAQHAPGRRDLRPAFERDAARPRAVAGGDRARPCCSSPRRAA